MQTSLGALGAALGAPAGVSPAHAALPWAPSHRSQSVPGIHGYADQESVAAGETITFHVSASARYQLEICRLGKVIDNPAAEEIIHDGGVFEPRVQPIHPGSYIHVAKGLRGSLAQCALECWVRAWKIERRAGMITQGDGFDGAGYGLFAEPAGGLAFYLSGVGRNPEPWLLRGAAELTPQKWHHVVANWDGKSASLWMDGRQLVAAEAQGRMTTGNGPLRLAAAGDRGRASHFLDADLANPVIYSQALTPDRIRTRFAEKGLVPPPGRSVLGFWPLTEERGAIVRDASGHRRDGRIINHATWMIGGPAFDAAVARFGSYAPEKDPQRGHGLRFAADDLYDCHWHPTYTFRVPALARPGIYVCRLTTHAEGGTAHYHITFIVRKSRRAKKAPVLVLAATNTWRAYSGTPFGNPPPGIKQVWSTNGTTNHAGNPPAYCFYRGHAAGQGTFQLGLRVPWPAAGPYVLYGRRTDYSHLMRADRFAHAWLEQSGYSFDVIADSDLHRNQGLLRGYRVLVINGHSEYWSIPMYRGLDSYLRAGGNVMCLSGNSLFWRVSFDPDQAVLECRKVDAPGDQLPPSRRGECWHSHDGKRGGLLRECGYPGGNLVGLETLGWNNQDNPDQFGAFTVDAPEHFLFRGPHLINLTKGGTFGTGPGGGLPRANGHEIDVRIATLAALQEKPAPLEASLPPQPEGMTRLANGSITWRIGGSAFDYFLRPVKPGTDQGAEMIYWERPAGGRVFNAGTIGAGWALLADENFGRLLKNVLHHFGVPWLR